MPLPDGLRLKDAQDILEVVTERVIELEDNSKTERDQSHLFEKIEDLERMGVCEFVLVDYANGYEIKSGENKGMIYRFNSGIVGFVATETPMKADGVDYLEKKVYSPRLGEGCNIFVSRTPIGSNIKTHYKSCS